MGANEISIKLIILHMCSSSLTFTTVNLYPIQKSLLNYQSKEDENVSMDDDLMSEIRLTNKHDE